MKKSVKRQLLEPTVFYASGFGISWLVLKMTKHPYAHGLDIWSLIALLVFLAGGVWLLKTLAQIFSGKKYYWTLLVHVLVIGGLLFSLILETNTSSTGKELPNQTLSIHSNPEDSVALLTTTNGDTLYFAKDSTILIDKLQ